ncbi:hypothetical protein [Jannaschia seohaensis]|uniref:Uncharacterized protein n=1 Tax=Jannaschia seohaensis TaxID=475081 RepID=A0A2Y9AP80_9RHOB|nr:hypothetical protein [Jannaschia seohaensis]PWJ19283.1 hypothetical protein BCF38_104217 [Jannaschia seohaensis]SSA45945.1 hypothetical protein SAMN05421539_104217 [Jannaschia seohaensis]
MTAIEGLERLETTALWRPEAGAQRREVYVSIGEAELVIQDSAGTALTHWSLPALVRVNAGAPAVYAPAPGTDEELEVEEPEMIAALDRVVAAVEKGRAKPGRLRRIATGLVLGAAVGFAIMWLPGALRDQAAGLLPPSKRSELGERMLAEFTLLTGPPCETVTGREALDRLHARLLPTTPGRIEVLRDLPHPALALPGGLLLLSDVPLLTQDDPDVAAGHLLAAAITAQERPPLEALLRDLGATSLIRLLTAGVVTDAEITEHVETLLLDAPPLAAPERLRPGFAAARLAWAPWATATGRAPGEAPASQMPSALDDDSWQRLREVCDG